jgi:hypothetical protein
VTINLNDFCAYSKLFVPKGFDHGGLRAALIAAGVAQVTEEIVEEAAAWICESRSVLTSWKESRKPPSKRLHNLQKALSECMDPQWLNSREAGLLFERHRHRGITVEGITKLAKHVDWAIAEQSWIQSRKPKGNPEKPLTAFFVSLIELYRLITGEEGISDGGPAWRFVKDCAALADPNIVVPERGFQSLMWNAFARRVNLPKSASERFSDKAWFVHLQKLHDQIP